MKRVIQVRDAIDNGEGMEIVHVRKRNESMNIIRTEELKE